MKRSFSTGLLLVVIIALAGYAVWQAHERRAAQARVARMHEQLEELRGAVRANEHDLLALRAQVAALIMTNRACQSPEGTAVRNYLESYGALMRTPEMQAALRAQLDAEYVAVVYAPLLDGVAVSAEEKQALRALLVERAVAESEPVFLLARPGLDAAARAHIRSNIPPALAALDAKITAMLTREDAAVFAGCTSNAEARLWVAAFNRHLAQAGLAPLSPVQQQHAVQTFAQSLAHLKAQPGYVDVELLAPEEITADIAARHLEQYGACFARVHGRLTALLPAAAARAFNDFAAQTITAGAARLQLTTRALGQ